MISLAGCVGCVSESRQVVVEDTAYEHSMHDATQRPDAVAACVVRNAKAAGYAASVQPLYGTAAMAVLVRTLAAGGDSVANLSILPAGGGSEVTATTMRDSRKEDRKAVLSRLLAGC